ncbi:hypothetical protein CFOL_v3_13913 [Cephalotus follicularis]|uniref:Uncharacterized protein n=1 Tax=Cephalotus follicularis TaxID=3775 RepID=A0A1Q3BR49_CEPFO|nr:hypothetical protein CFOL_v3_13913 [Cephalotus follicularis]
MVFPLGPGKFYGSSLPRPRIYTDVKHSVDRVDPPVSVMDPFLSWANEAHWSMGGLSFKRLRLQGRIEGSVKRLKSEREKREKKQKPISEETPTVPDPAPKNKNIGKRMASLSPPPAPFAAKRRRYLALSEEEDGENEEVEEKEKVRVTRRLARKLGDDFDRVAKDSDAGVVKQFKGYKGGDGVDVECGTRSSPRFSSGKGGAVEAGPRASPRLAKRSLN